MVTLNTPRQSSLVLSRDAVFDHYWPAIRDSFPDGATTHLDFYNSNGDVVASVNGTVEARKLVYLVTDTDALNGVSNGSQYELFVVTTDGPYKVEYGHVIRREASFYTPLPVGTELENDARLFSDLLNRDAVGRRWIVTKGGIAMHPLGTDPETYAMGPDTGLLFSEAGMRYFRPMGGDSWRIKFSIYSTGSFIGLGGTGKMRVHMGCDSRLNVGMGFEIETGSSNNRVHTGLVTSPTDMDYTGSPVDNESEDGDIWTVDYNDLTKTMNVYKGPEPYLDPVISWEDTADLLPHGIGYRHWGFSWDSSLLATGALLRTVEAQDYV
ncbi:MAG TPA: hypothetical protein VJ777_03340 [Mycobacterium sp.]|nr:hypothetical protein [Mycobacterium sp.]